jgi:hypothetical protein
MRRRKFGESKTRKNWSIRDVMTETGVKIVSGRPEGK